MLPPHLARGLGVVCVGGRYFIYYEFWLQLEAGKRFAEFRPLFEIATTRAGSEVALITQTPQTHGEPEESESWSWWRRGRVGCSLFANKIRSPFTWPTRRHSSSE